MNKIFIYLFCAEGINIEDAYVGNGKDSDEESDTEYEKIEDIGWVPVIKDTEYVCLARYIDYYNLLLKLLRNTDTLNDITYQIIISYLIK